MRISNWDLMNLAQEYDGEFDAADFSFEELDKILGSLDEDLTVEELREKYFEYYDDVKDRTLHKHKWSD